MIGAGHIQQLAAIADAIEVAPGAKRVQLFPGYGVIRGRNGAGPYILQDRAHAEQVIAATMSAQGSVDLHFDYDHQAVRAPAVAGTAVAAGWIKGLSADDDGIWAEDVEWTATASAAIDAREYRYASPYFLHDRAGRVTRIVNAALTNTPNFNLAALASAIGAPIGDVQSMNEFAAIVAALGLPAETTLDQVVAAIGDMRAASTTAAIASALGLPETSDTPALASAIAALKASVAKPDPTKFVPVEQLQAVTAKLSTIDGERAQAAVASAIRSGKLAPALKDWGIDYFKKDEAAFASFVATTPVLLTPGTDELRASDLGDANVLSGEEKAIASMMGWNEAEMLAQKKLDGGAR